MGLKQGINKLGNEIAEMQAFVADEKNRCRWQDIPEQARPIFHNWAKTQKPLNGKGGTRYSFFNTSNGPKYFNWNDYPG